jgi:ABC-2 type transport system permease protein
MDTPANAVPELPVDTLATAPAVATSATRPLYWSVRRELWENRSIYVAPLVAAGVMLFGFSIRTIGLPQRMRTLSGLDPVKQHAVVVMPYSVAATLIILTAYLVGVFYSLEALHGERRDRSILFWKSLPVSDLTTVLSKACIPLVVLPLVAFTVSLAAQLAMLLWSSTVLQASGVGAATLWTRLPFVQMTFIMLYGLTVHALWHAPLYGWLLLVSGWARRAPFLWAVLPLLAIGVFERHVFQTSHFGSLMRYRLIGAMQVAFALDGQKHPDFLRLNQLDPARFLSTPGLWIGLFAAAAFLAAAARLRRNREPV